MWTTITITSLLASTSKLSMRKSPCESNWVHCPSRQGDKIKDKTGSVYGTQGSEEKCKQILVKKPEGKEDLEEQRLDMTTVIKWV
jgi:glycerol kinase